MNKNFSDYSTPNTQRVTFLPVITVLQDLDGGAKLSEDDTEDAVLKPKTLQPRRALVISGGLLLLLNPAQSGCEFMELCKLHTEKCEQRGSHGRKPTLRK